MGKEEKRGTEDEKMRKREEGKEGERCVATLLNVCCCLVVFIMNNSGSKQLSPPYELKLVLKISYCIRVIVSFSWFKVLPNTSLFTVVSGNSRDLSEAQAL